MTLLLLLQLVACTEESAPDVDSLLADSKSVMAEGSPEALGVLSMLNDAGTTLTDLDVDAGLDRRAASGLISHRDGGAGTADDNPFDTVAEVDDVKYVGDTALSALLAYAIDTGWVAVDEDYYGTIESVSFTKAEAAAIVDLVNVAELETLDVDVALDSRAAANLVAQRPFATLEDVAKVSYVGTTALNNLKSYVQLHEGPLLNTADAVATLTADVAGMYFMSESDYPLVVWSITDNTTTDVTSANVLEVLSSVYGEDRSVEASSMDWFFDRYTEEQTWWDDWYRAEAAKWRVVRGDFEGNLQSPTVWRFGSTSIDVFIIAVSTDGDLVGIRTVSIET